MADHIDLSATRPTRRDFVLTGTAITAAGVASLASAQEASSAASPSANKPLINDGDTILFQGDSITDAGRKRDKQSEPNSFAALGEGYAWLAAAQLLIDKPTTNLRIFNRGTSGNKVYQMAERWQEDCLELKPDMLSILIGVNDFWHKHKHGYEGTLEKYETDYRALVQRTKESLPEVKLAVCEPFVLKVGAVDESWFPEFDAYRAAAKRVAEEAGATFVPFQTMFDEAAKFAPREHWAEDGVHPTTYGAALMAREWLKAVGA